MSFDVEMRQDALYKAVEVAKHFDNPKVVELAEEFYQFLKAGVK